MSGTVREDLLGYLLNALDDHEHRRVALALECDELLQRELACLERHLAVLAADRDHHDPPTGLALRTCCCLDGASDEEGGEGSIDALEPPANFERVSIGGAETAGQARHATEREHAPHPLSPLREFVSFGSWNLAEVVVLAGIVLVVSFLFFPAIAHSRYRARLAACQNNFLQLGFAFAGYSESNPGYLPQLTVRGNRSFAGIYYPILYDGGYLSSPGVVVCPGVDRPMGASARPNVTLRQVDAARGQLLAELQRQAGGDYAYLLGFFRNGVYQGPRTLHRTHFPVLGDAPGGRLAGVQSDNHEGRGQNILFEDLHYQYLDRTVSDEIRDNLYTNRAGWVAPGADEDDAVLAPSETPLFTFGP